MPEQQAFGDGRRAQLHWLLTMLASSMGLTREAIDLLVRFAEFDDTRKGETICDGGRRTKFVRFSMSGVLKLVCWPGSFEPLTVRFLGPQSFVCAPPPRPCAGYQVAVTVHEPGTLALIGYRDFRRATAVLGDRTATLASWSFRAMTDHLYRKVSLLRLKVTQRLVYELPILAHELPAKRGDGIEIATCLLHEDLAALVGSTRPSVCRAMGRLRALGFVGEPGIGRVIVSKKLLDADPGEIAKLFESKRG